MQEWSILFVVVTTSAGLAIEFSQLLRVMFISLHSTRLLQAKERKVSGE